MQRKRLVNGERLSDGEYWPYGMEANRKTLEKLVLYAQQQGLTPPRLEVEELFGESMREDSLLS